MTRAKRRTPEHFAWANMKARCSNPNIPSYQGYGSRGIQVCKRWNSFDNFYADMGPRPSDKHSIDRINNDGDYEPGNCRWATKRQQGRNQRNNVWITRGSQTLIAADWAEELGLNLRTIMGRHRRGDTSERILRPTTHRKARDIPVGQEALTAH